MILWNNKFIRAISLIILMTILLFGAETGKLAGVVQDSETGEPLIGANVIISGYYRDGKFYEDIIGGAGTDAQGEYYIINIPPGVYNVKITYMGYSTKIIERVKVNIDKTTRINIDMKRQAIAGEEIVVTSYKDDEVEQDLTATRQNYRIEDTESMAGISDIGDVINLQADVEDGHFRGGRAGESMYYLDGGSLVNPLNNSKSFNPITIGLQQVDVYTSGFSAEYGNVQSGVVNMVQKEGDSKEWVSHLDVSATNSYYQRFGGNVFSADYLDFFNMLNSDEEWATGHDPITGTVLWAYFGIHFPENYMRDTKVIPGFPPKTIYPSKLDTLRAAHLIRTLWLQSVRDVGIDHNGRDKRVEFSTGGPLTDNVTTFIAAREDINASFLPSTKPSRDRQIMGNFAYKPNSDNKFKLNYTYNYSYENAFPDDFGRWFEYLINTEKEISTTYQLGLSWKHVFSKSTSMNLKINNLNTKNESLIDILEDDEYSNRFSSDLNWRHLTAPTGYEYGKILSENSESKTKSFSIKGDINSQINNNNYIKSGFQFNYYDLQVYDHSHSSSSSESYNKYHEYPYEGALYVQDKMEFKGMIANLGLRYDFYNFNTEYYTDRYSPYRNPDYNPDDPDKGPLISEKYSGKDKTEIESIFQPRLGISFPVTEKTVLHMNYGVFMQRAQFNRVFLHEYSTSETPNYQELGNPQLKPKKTISYDAGIVRALPFGFHLDVSAYLKDVSNLTQYAYFKDQYGYFYYTFINREYADIKGFHVSFEKRTGFIRGHIRYNWESDKGKAASATGGGSARARFYEDNPAQTELPDPADVYLSYNRLHRISGNLRFQTPGNAGFKMLGIRPLANIRVSATYKYLSGRPFTFDDKGLGLRMNKRTPDEHHLKFRATKSIQISNNKLNIYVEGYNMLKERVFNYDEVFGGMSGSGRYTDDYINNRDEIFTDDTYTPYVTSIDAFLLSNSPRHYRLGVELEF